MTPEQRRRLSAAAVAASVIGGMWVLSSIAGIVAQILAIPYAPPSGLNEAFTAILGAGGAVYVQQHKARVEAAARRDAAPPAPPDPPGPTPPPPPPPEPEGAPSD